MKNLPSLCVTAFISVFALCAGLSAADVIQNFNGGSGQTPYVTARNGNLNPLADGCGEMDGYFRLLNRTGSLQQSLIFNNTGYATNFISASFDLRMIDGADGVNFSLVNTDTYTNFANLFSRNPSSDGIISLRR